MADNLKEYRCERCDFTRFIYPIRGPAIAVNFCPSCGARMVLVAVSDPLDEKLFPVIVIRSNGYCFLFFQDG